MYSDDNYASIANEHYSYDVALTDLRNHTRLDGNNLPHLVNRYMDAYLDHARASNQRAASFYKLIRLSFGSGCTSYGWGSVSCRCL